jgi:CBS domain-containing protein
MVLFAKDIVDTEFIALPQSSSALEGAKAMKAKKHGFVVVVAPDGSPVGMVTEWDYIERLISEEKDPATTTLEQIMSRNIITVKANDGIDVVANVMSQNRVRRVLVLQDGRVVGAITERKIVGSLKDYVDSVSSQIARLQTPPV